MHADPPEDYYALLGVDPDVDAVQLRRVWRQLALRWHPDRAGPSATATFQKLSIAYAVLSDPVARAEYDQARGRSAPPPRRAAPRRPPDDFLWRICGSFKTLLARGVARRDEEGVVELVLNRQEAATGGMVAISMRVPVRCLLCRGKNASCDRCAGKGAVNQLFSARLGVPPDVADGTLLDPLERLSGMVRPVRFRIRIEPAE
ncbi:MAG: DnaJ domain-containing protein [Myxococcales bacterium]